MKLFEHRDFEQLVLRAAEHFKPRGLRPAILEKDYYVTEALRIVAGAGDRTIFKGGTSLSKGWNLIDRFSEDIDIFLDPAAFKPPLGKRAIDRELKVLRDAVAKHPALTFVKEESQTVGGFGRNDRFSYVQRFGGTGEVANRVLLEAGTDFRRTFVEKMFAIHSKVEILKRDRTPLGTYARHYYDLVQLAKQPDVIAMLKSDEYGAIKTDYDSISKAHFPNSYFWPADMKFANSEALFPPDALARTLAAEYETQCRQLCYGPYPSWAQVHETFAGLRKLL